MFKWSHVAQLLSEACARTRNSFKCCHLIESPSTDSRRRSKKIIQKSVWLFISGCGVLIIEGDFFALLFHVSRRSSEPFLAIKTYSVSKSPFTDASFLINVDFRVQNVPWPTPHGCFFVKHH